MSNITHWLEVDEVYADFFGGHHPARAVVPTATLHYGAAIEVEAIARMRDRAPKTTADTSPWVRDIGRIATLAACLTNATAIRCRSRCRARGNVCANTGN